MEQWWREIPIVTKWLFAASFGVTLAANFGLVSGASTVLMWSEVVHHFQLWRLVTCFFIHGLGFNFLMNMMFLYKHSGLLENGTFDGRTSDYIFFLLFGCSVLVVVGFFFRWGALGVSMILMIVYYWSRMHPDEEISFMFGIRMQSKYLPWALCAMNLLMGGMPVAQLAGIVVGHLYYFLEDIYPRTSGRRLLFTPAFLYRWLPLHLNRNTAFAQGGRLGRPGAAAPAATGHQWGAGRRLGGR